MKPENILFILVCSTSLLIGLILPPAHDYAAYIKQWTIIHNGLDPYFKSGNAYGVAYNYFAYLNFSSFLHIPRVIFIATYLFASFLIWKLSKKQIGYTSNWILTILIINPLFWIFSIKYGSNDSFLAGITMIAVLVYIRKYYYLTGILFAIGFCFKFTPIFIIPFFILSRKEINFKVLFSFITGVLSIYGIGFLQWGNSIVEPFLFGERRVSKIFSIFRFIRGEVKPLKFIGVENLDEYSIYMTLICITLIFLTYLALNLDRYLSSLLSLSTTLLFYKVGHHQFYLLFMIFTVFTIVFKKEKNKPFLCSALTLFSWIFFFTILYDFTSRYKNGYSLIRTWIGLPTFLIHTILNINLINVIYKNKKSANTVYSK